MWRVTVLVARHPNLAPDPFSIRWIETLAPAIAKAAKADGFARRVIVNLPPTTVDPRVAAAFPPPYDGLLELWFESAEDAVAGLRRLSEMTSLRDLAQEILEGASGAAWLAQVIPCKPEQGTKVKFLAAGDVAEGVALDDAHRYWAETHPQVAQTAPEVWNALTRYTQFHGTVKPALDMGTWLATARFVPMCSDMGFARQDDFVAAYMSKQYAAIVRPDEEKFSRPGEMLSFISVEERVLAP